MTKNGTPSVRAMSLARHTTNPQPHTQLAVWRPIINQAGSVRIPMWSVRTQGGNHTRCGTPDSNEVFTWNCLSRNAENMAIAAVLPPPCVSLYLSLWHSSLPMLMQVLKIVVNCTTQIYWIIYSSIYCFGILIYLVYWFERAARLHMVSWVVKNYLKLLPPFNDVPRGLLQSGERLLVLRPFRDLADI